LEDRLSDSRETDFDTAVRVNSISTADRKPQSCFRTHFNFGRIAFANVAEHAKDAVQQAEERQLARLKQATNGQQGTVGFETTDGKVMPKRGLEPPPPCED